MSVPKDSWILRSKSKKDIFNLVNYVSNVDVITFENKNLLLLLLLLHWLFLMKNCGNGNTTKISDSKTNQSRLTCTQLSNIFHISQTPNPSSLFRNPFLSPFTRARYLLKYVLSLIAGSEMMLGMQGWHSSNHFPALWLVAGAPSRPLIGHMSRAFLRPGVTLWCGLTRSMTDHQ